MVVAQAGRNQVERAGGVPELGRDSRFFPGQVVCRFLTLAIVIAARSCTRYPRLHGACGHQHPTPTYPGLVSLLFGVVFLYDFTRSYLSGIVIPATDLASLSLRSWLTGAVVKRLATVVACLSPC